MWLDGHLGDLWKLAVSRATSSTHVHQKKVPVRKKLTSAICLAQDGLYGKACQTLTSSDVAPNNPTTWNLLVSKHPSCTCPSVPDTPHTDFKLPSTLNLMAILRSFPKLTAAGPSGLQIQHLIDAAEVPLQTPVLHSLRAVIDLLVSGRAPAEVAVFLAGGNLTALNKPAPGDIRPIAVGESIRRLTGKCLCVALKDKAASFFEPSQFGVACPNGAEKVIHGLRACMDKHWFDDDCGVLKIDMKNAFNLVSRQALLSECAKHFPELFPWVSWCYGQHPLLWHSLGCLTSESGVQQGDPLGLLLFSLVLNILVKAISTTCSNLLNHAWYMDDGVLAGPRATLCRAITLLQSEGPALGIHINMSKCEVFSSHSLDLYPPGMISSDKPNLVILGAPIGNKEFCSSFVSKGLKNVAGLWSQLEEVGLIDPQVALILLRLCGALCKLVHLTRATPTSLIKDALAVFDAGVRRTFCLCTGVDVSNDAWQQAQLSLGKGGLGLRSLSLHSPAAFIASVCSVGYGSHSTSHLSQAIDMFNCLVASSDVISVENLLSSCSVHQKALSEKLDDRQFNLLLNCSSVADRARLLSVSSPFAASWLSVIPSEGLGLHLTAPIFQVALKCWLGLDTSGGS